MKKYLVVITGLILALFKRDKEVDYSFAEAIFGKRETAPIAKGEEVKIYTFASQNSCATTGDFYATPTRVCPNTGKTIVSFIPFVMNENVAVSPDDGFVREQFAETDPKVRALMEKNAKQLAPIKVLENRRQNLALMSAASMATTGKIVHHNGTIDLGFTDRDTLIGTNKWNDASSDPVQDVIGWYDGMNETSDAVFMDSLAKKLFMAKARTAYNATTGENENFAKATAEEVKSKSISKKILFVGTITERQIDIYEVTGKKVDEKGAKSNILEANTVLFVPLNNREAAGWYHASIPQVDINKNGIDANYVQVREIIWNSKNKLGTEGETGMLSSFAPAITNPDFFKYVKVA